MVSVEHLLVFIWLIVAIYKEGGMDLDIYGGVTSVSVVSKLLEKLMLVRIESLLFRM